MAAGIVGAGLIVWGAASSLVALVIIGLALAAWAGWDYMQLDKRRDAQRARGEERKALARQKLQASLAELVDYHDEWEKADVQAEDARELLLAISPVEQMAVSAHDAREVL
jgi:hypothetical protein